MALFGPPKPDKFAQMFISALRAAGDTREVQYDANDFRLLFFQDGEANGIANLRNLYDEFCAAPKAERPQCLRAFVKALLSQFKEMPADFEDIKVDLRPRIWPRCTFEKVRLQNELEGTDDVDIPMQSVGEHLVVTLVYDLPEAVHTIGQEHLDDWGISFYEAMEFARQNLEESDFAFASIGERLFGSLTGDTYDATRLLLLDLVRKLEVKGQHIAMVPNRDTLLITGLDDDEGLEMMQEFAAKVLEDQPRPMFAMPLRLDGDEWVDWMPDPSHALHEQFRSLELKWLNQEYADQKELLDATYDMKGIDVFVASHTAAQNEKTGELVSYCVWANGVDSLLPITQKIALIRGENDNPAIASWERVQEVVGHLLEPVEAYPPRFRVTEFPNEEQLAAIGDEGL